jgi:DNA-binding NtrC family response regulator
MMAHGGNGGGGGDGGGAGLGGGLFVGANVEGNVGNVFDLQQAVSRPTTLIAEARTISVGWLPPEEVPAVDLDDKAWLDLHLERPIKRAVLLGAGLKDIGRAAEDVAIRCVTNEEDGNLQRAARRLGVTDRALQLRRAHKSVGCSCISGLPAQSLSDRPA